MLGLETQLNKTQGLPVRSSQSEGERQGHTDGALSQGRMGWGVWCGPSVDTNALVIQRRRTHWKCGSGWGLLVRARLLARKSWLGVLRVGSLS